ncbi:nuclease [Spirosoma taeanense]|uniref:Nuclease n=1 Tax=Spirosoma taeanense TaxID=2735870 RepID=A0A6M5Y847_9BACT|nr:nuclease A inhibitor family protein [Spirosoma taeanense]QJW90105.1 nuclease [Spirosoma taeanense]
MTNEATERNDQPAEDRPFEQAAAPLLADLLYPSESDEPVEFVLCYLNQPEPLTVSQIKDWLMLPPSVYVEEVPETTFWEPVVTGQDWFGDEEKKRLAQFQQLNQLVEQKLTGRQVFRVGETEVKVYLLGQQSSSGRAGLKTTLVET